MFFFTAIYEAAYSAAVQICGIMAIICTGLMGLTILVEYVISEYIEPGRCEAGFVSPKKRNK